MTAQIFPKARRAHILRSLNLILPLSLPQLRMETFKITGEFYALLIRRSLIALASANNKLLSRIAEFEIPFSRTFVG